MRIRKKKKHRNLRTEKEGENDAPLIITWNHLDFFLLLWYKYFVEENR